MSKLSVNELTDETGSGAPSFPNGVSVTGAALTDPEITGGIYLGGTGSANYLDDYEEGTWTAEYGGRDGDPSIVYLQQKGSYTKIGNVVYFRVQISTDSIDSQGNGNATLKNLPFTVNQSSGGGVITFTNDWNTDNHPLVGLPKSNSNFISLLTGSGDVEDEIRKKIDASNFRDGSRENQLQMWGFYYTDS